MNVDDIKTTAVIGAGEIGHGIAVGLALAGYQVRMNSTTEASLEKGMAAVQADLDRLVNLGFVSPDQAAEAPDRISTTLSLEEAAQDADVVFEAVYENIALKQQIFGDLDRFCPERTILASSTSTIIPSFLAEPTQRPDRVLVAHYNGPSYLSPLVEIVRNDLTSDETVEAVYQILLKVGKSPVLAQKEVPGFIANRLLAALLREALSMVQRGIASPEDIDTVLKTGHARRWVVAGVFEMVEIAAGWDLALAAYPQVLPDIDSSPSDILTLVKEMVDQGKLGAKSGQGFFDWTPESAEASRQKMARAFVEIEKWYREGHA